MLLPCRYPRACLVIALLFSTAAGAEEMGLAESLARAERYSADLSATVYQRQALENQADTANQLPDPQLKFGIENVPVGGSNDPLQPGGDDHEARGHHAGVYQSDQT